MQQGELNDIKDFCTQKLLTESNNENSFDLSENFHPAVTQQDCQPVSPSFQQSDLSACVLQPSFRKATFFFPTLVRNTQDTASESARDEIERYANEIVRITENFDVIMWWKNNGAKYPRLSKIAINLLSIPASSAASERVFSLAGNIITEKRNRLEPKTVASILFLNSLAKKKRW